MRKMLHIPLEGNVIVFDEAHNIVDAVNDTHTYTTSFSDVRMSLLYIVLSNISTKKKTNTNRYATRSDPSKDTLRDIEIVLKDVIELIYQDYVSL